MTTADEFRTNSQALQEQIRREQSLTPLAQKVRIGKLHLQASAEIAKVQASDEAEKKRRDDKAMATAFGPGSTDPATIASSRAARAQVDAIDVTDRHAERTAAEILTTATQLGDYPLRQAVALKAHRSGWQDVVQQWSAAAKPAQIEALNQLRASEKPTAVAMFKYVNPFPPEFSNARSDHDIANFIDANEAMVSSWMTP